MPRKGYTPEQGALVNAARGSVGLRPIVNAARGSVGLRP